MLIYRKIKNLYDVKKVIVVFLAFIFIISNNKIFANSIENNTNETDENEIQKKVGQKEFDIIENILSDIKAQRNKINSKLDATRATDEFLNYPAVRLNVDTPIFGISDIVNNELKINYDVSSSDISAGYSIDDVIKSNKVKVPSYTVVSIIMKTRDIEINKDMSVSDANLVLFKLIDYYDKIKSVNDKLDGQINNILSGYVDKDKTSKINNINKNINDILSKNSTTSDLINKIFLIDSNNTDDFSTQNNNIYFDLQKSKKSLSNTLTSSDSVSSISKSTDSSELSMVELLNSVQKSYNDKTGNIDREKLLTNNLNFIKSQNDYIINYVNNSDGTFQNNRNFCYDSEYDNLSKLVDRTYTITSKDLVNELQKYEDDAQKQLNDFEKAKKSTDTSTTQNTNSNSNDTQENSNSTNVSETDAQKYNDETVELLKSINKSYSDFLSKESSFLKDNINMLEEDSKNKLELISQNTDEDIYDYVKYMYIDLDSSMDALDQKTNYQSNKSLLSEIESLKSVLSNVLNLNLKINKIYDQKVLNTSGVNGSNGNS